MALTEKFKKDISTLRAAAAGEIFLDVKNPKLFKKKRVTTNFKHLIFCKKIIYYM